uniref:Integrase catalytic domain-containing protein n=1 Tax=Trichogramma kaykai TaxID=54128 RepID=A0ABD2WAE1_9HYME
MKERKLEGPWVTVASDVMGPLPRSKGGFKYIVVFQDLFTKYIEVRAFRSANSVTIGKAFEELILNRWGCPKYLLTDNGTEYVNNSMKKRMNELGIIQTTIAPYHAQANPVERVNRTIKTMMSIYVENNHKLWDVYLNEFTFAINTTPNSSTKYSPAYLNFGRNPRMIVTLRNELDSPSHTLTTLTQESWAHRIERLPALYQFVKENLKIANEHQAKQYNKNRKEIIYKVGDRVLRKTHTISSAPKEINAKFAEKWDGPCKIIKVLSNTVYELEHEKTGKKSKVYVNDMKKLKSDECDPLTFSDTDAHKDQNVHTKKQRHQKNYTTQTAADDGREECRYHLRRRRTPAT